MNNNENLTEDLDLEQMEKDFKKLYKELGIDEKADKKFLDEIGVDKNAKLNMTKKEKEEFEKEKEANKKFLRELGVVEKETDGNQPGEE